MAMNRRTLITRLSAAALAAPATALAQGRAPVRVVASFSVLADVVRVVAGPRARITMLVGLNEDAHHYDPKPGDARALAEAQLLVENGLGFERWLDPLATASGFSGQRVAASAGVSPILVRETIPDPHVWQSFENAKIYAGNVERALAAASPADRAAFARNRAAFDADVDAAFTEAKAAMAQVSAPRGLFLVPHNSFRYMGRELGLTFRGLRALNTGAQPSAKEVAQLIGEIRAAGAAAAFVENITDPRLIRQIAAESGAHIGGKLYSDALSLPTEPAATYGGMLRHNARTLVAAARAIAAPAR